MEPHFRRDSQTLMNAAAIDGGKPLDLHQSLREMFNRKLNHGLISHNVLQFYRTKHEV